MNNLKVVKELKEEVLALSNVVELSQILKLQFCSNHLEDMDLKLEVRSLILSICLYYLKM